MKRIILRPAEAPLCACGCGQPVKWTRCYGQFSSHWNTYLHNHWRKKRVVHRNPPLCACGCGQSVEWGKEWPYHWNIYLSGHQNRGRIATKQAKENLSISKSGPLNPMWHKEITDAHRLHLCQAAEGHVVTKITRSRIRKRLKGKKKSAEHTAKNRASHLNVKLSAQHRINIGLALLGRVQSKKTRLQISKSRMGKYGGENSPRWLGGISKLPYPFIWTVELRNSIWKRDSYKCQSPFCKGRKCRLQTHHIDYDKNNCLPENLITLCIVCHTKTNSNREYWKGIFQHGIH